MDLCQVYVILMPYLGPWKHFGKHEQMVLKAVLIMFKLIFNNRMKSIKKASWEVGYGSQNHTRTTPATAEWLPSRMPVWSATEMCEQQIWKKR